MGGFVPKELMSKGMRKIAQRSKLNKTSSILQGSPKAPNASFFIMREFEIEQKGLIIGRILPRDGKD
jgi:hypothetical protein